MVKNFAYLLVVCVAFYHNDAFASIEVQHQGDASYITGGVGDEETTQLESAKKDYNVHILNSDREGHYSDGIHIKITDKNHESVLDAESGPLFYAQLPKGRYTVEASSDGSIQKKTITVGKNANANVRFTWIETESDTE